MWLYDAHRFANKPHLRNVFYIMMITNIMSPWDFWAAASVQGHASFAVLALNAACSPAGSAAQCHAVAGSVLHVTGVLPFVDGTPVPESSHDALAALSVPVPADADACSVPATMWKITSITHSTLVTSFSETGVKKSVHERYSGSHSSAAEDSSSINW